MLSFFLFIFSWSLCSVVACKMSQRIQNEISRTQKPSYWVMICAILDQDQYPNISKVSFTILSLLTSTLFYLLIDCFMLNMISTDLVVTAKPSVIQSYDEIIVREDLRVFDYKGSSAGRLFKRAVPGSKFHEVAKKVKLYDFILDAYNVWEPIRDQKMILASSEWGSVYIGTKYRALVPNELKQTIRILLTKDETGQRATNAFMVSKHITKLFRSYVDEK